VRALGKATILCCAAVVLALAVSAALAQPAPYLGRWTENPAWCANTDRNSDDMPITITARAIETCASHCRVLSVKRERVVWRIRTSCRDEGQMENEPRTRATYTLRLIGDKLTMRDNTGVQNFVRCKP
jgi:hypothetical protein